MRISTKPITHTIRNIKPIKKITGYYNPPKSFLQHCNTLMFNTINTKTKPIKLDLYSYTNMNRYIGNFEIDLKKPQKFILKKLANNETIKNPNKYLIVFYDPKRNAKVFEKVINPVTKQIEKKPLDVNIMQSNDGIWETTFYFMKKDLSECVGYVTIGDWSKLAKFNSNEYKYKQGITVSMLQNHNDKKYSGIGKLADRLEIEYCLKNGIKPIIISEADPGSHIAHYKRGKRFFKLPNGNAKDFFIKNYNSDNLNNIIAKLIKENSGKKIDISNWPIVNMILSPKAVHENLLKIKEKPIL